VRTVNDLKNRIAKVLTDFAPTMPKAETVWCADAIIAELGLEEQVRQPVTFYSAADNEIQPDITIRRYFTRWESV
jgi:hypothetical protein